MLGITEWSFVEYQSNIQGRTGSNACVFIAIHVHMGKLCYARNLTWPSGDLLSESWKRALQEAMIKGKQIHDDLFDHHATNVTVEDAESMAGEECGVQTLGQQIDIFGINPVNQLSNWLLQKIQDLSRSFSVIVADDRAFLIVPWLSTHIAMETEKPSLHAVKVFTDCCINFTCLLLISINLLAFYPKYCSLIGYATHYLFCDR